MYNSIVTYRYDSKSYDEWLGGEKAVKGVFDIAYSDPARAFLKEWHVLPSSFRQKRREK